MKPNAQTHVKAGRPVINKKTPYDKIGVDEVQGLGALLDELCQPICEQVDSMITSHDPHLKSKPAEYKSRDGFIPYSSNCGGRIVSLVVPKCDECAFDHVLEFGECGECKPGDRGQCGYEGCECAAENDGYLDAYLRVWFKFEGIDDRGVMSFYLVVSGGNADAPYFRTDRQPTLFELSFEAASLKAVRSKGQKAVAKVVKFLREGSVA